MCQNWYSVIGQVLDVIGFLTIAWEWHYGYEDIGAEIVEKLNERLQEQDLEEAEQYGMEPTANSLQSRYVREEYWKEYYRRGNIFRLGVTLVVLGFIFQVLGSWPHLFRSC